MKHISILFIGILTAFTVFANNVIDGNNLTVSINGNKNLQVSVDGRDFNLSNSSVLGNKTTLTLNNLEMGQHTLQITRTDLNTMRSGSISAPFNLRNNYEMLINVNHNGSLELIENVKPGNSDNQVPVNSADFNILLRNVKAQRAANGRRNVIATAFNNTSNYFTTNQVVQLLQLVTAENFRLQLSKISYRSVTDRSNFYQVYDLLRSQEGKDELVAYVNNFNEGGDSNSSMNNANFNTLYETIHEQWPVGRQMNSLTSAFNNTANHFTTYQASQLIQIISAEASRLQLAKLSYRSITDPGNFNQIYNLFSTQAAKNELKAYINNNYNNDSNPNGAMTDANFNSLFQTIQQQWPVGVQMNSLTSAFNNNANHFTTYQASQLIQIVSAEASRLQLAKLSYRSIIDRGNFNQIYNLLSTQAAKNELKAYINNNYNNDNIPNGAMTDANFNSLYQTIQQQWPVGVQMNSLTNAFNNNANHFTTYQASQLIQIVSAEANRLQLAKLSYRSITDRGNFNQIYNLLSTQAAKNELKAYINYNYNNDNDPNGAMTDANFNSLYETIQQQWPVGMQMNSLTSAFNNNANHFTTYQASQLIQIVSAEASRLQLAKLSYRSITDRGNFNQIYNLLNTQASKNELAAYLNTNYNTGIVTNVAMTDANFNTLYQTIQGQYLPFEQMNSLTSVFNNTSNYFTSAQAKQLIPLVSLESNRLQLAKLSYRTIVDRDNFSQLYELLYSQAGKNELDAYVKAYKD